MLTVEQRSPTAFYCICADMACDAQFADMVCEVMRSFDAVHSAADLTAHHSPTGCLVMEFIMVAGAAHTVSSVKSLLVSALLTSARVMGDLAHALAAVAAAATPAP